MTLLEQLIIQFERKFDSIELLRDMIGQVYIVKSDRQRYILKVFRKEHTSAAIQSANVMMFLKKSNFTVPEIILTTSGSCYFLLEDDQRVAILYMYIEGSEPERAQHLETIGNLVGNMRKTMEQYNGELHRKDEKFYIERYISILEQKKVEEVDEFAEYGKLIWNRVKGLPVGFCHGDMHIGNMILTNSTITVFDFDACGTEHPIYDIATLCDGTNYFDLSKSNFELGVRRTKENVDVFLQGYTKYYGVTEKEIRAVYDYIAIRHYDIQATIIECLGLNCVDNNFLTNQYKWLMNWEEECTKL
jgi:Ser/Thr protein kinase RdoA (MazF antagonist)